MITALTDQSVRTVAVPPAAPAKRFLSGWQPYQATVDAMHACAGRRHPDEPGEVWFLEHSPVISCGRRASLDMGRVPDNIPVVHSDRGGLATWHGPGQLVIYPIVPVTQPVRTWVRQLLHVTGQALRQAGVDNAREDFARTGVFTVRGKIASLGIRVHKGTNRHGVSINVNLQPDGFVWIDPCGDAGQSIDQSSHYCDMDVAGLADIWWQYFLQARQTGL